MLLNTQATETGRFSGVMLESNTPKGDSEYLGSCTWLNMTGDITIVWDENNREKILAVIKKKMDEGYTFFTTKKYMFGTVVRKSEVTKRDITRGKIEEIIITDEQFDKMIDDMDDSDVASLVAGKSASLVKRKGKSEIAALTKANRPEDVINRDSVAVRPLRGG